MTRSGRVALAGVFHETNSFSRLLTDKEAFRHKCWATGEALAAAYAGTRTVMGGFLDGARTHHLRPVPLFGAYATSAGPVTREASDEIEQTLAEALRAGGSFDGVLLELHGAMVVEDEPDPETRLLESIRDVVGDRPVVAVTDLHANMSAERLALVDVLTGYRTNPHVDTYERGAAAAGVLARLLRQGLRPRTAHRRVPLLAAPIAQATADEPLRSVLARAAALERDRGIIDVTVHGGYAYADVAHAGMSVTATADADPRRAAEVAEELAALAWERRDAFAVELPDAATAFDRACARAEEGGPVAVADTGDNIGGGSAGDGTWLLHEALARPGTRAATTICDPAAVRAAGAAGAGGRVRCDVGGWSADTSGPPVPLDARVRWLGEGTFTNKGPMGRGARTSMGPCAVLSAGTVDVLVQSLPIQPNDPELFRCAGLDPASYDVLILKGAAALRAGWHGLVVGFVDAGTRGVTATDLRDLPYANVARPVWPLDE